jgi:hypothetical protein
MYEATLPTLRAPRIRDWSCAVDPASLIANPKPLLPGEALTDAHSAQVRYIAPVFFANFERLAQVARDCAAAPGSYVTVQLIPGRGPRIRIENADSTEPFTTVLKDPGCSMLHCGVYVWLTVTHGSLNVTRPDARPSSCVHLLSSSPDHVLARSRHGLEMLIIPSQQRELWAKSADEVWAALTSSANTL